MKNKKVIQLELNEISKKIIDKMIAEGKLKNFQYINRNYDYVTTTSDLKYENIEPWIQWVSAHTGKSYDEHKIFHLGDAENLQYPQVWETLYENGLKSAIVGSMNVKQGRATNGVFFPDPWSKDGKTNPDELQPLWNLVASKVQTHATAKLKIADLFNGLRCCLKYKIPLKLYIKIAKQIVSQKINPKKKWRMAALFDELLSCIFMTLLKKTNFSYYTLFLNACAHYQHHYWRDFQPELFDPNIKTPDVNDGADPISYGYSSYDMILGKLLDYVHENDDVTLIIASAFTQEPYLLSECQGGMNYYRLKDHLKFLKSLEIYNVNTYPMMSRDWQVTSDNHAVLNKIFQILKTIKVQGTALFHVSQNSDHSLFISTAITRAVSDHEMVMFQDKALGKFNDLFTNIAIKSGHHISEGSLWLGPYTCSTNLKLVDGLNVSEIYKINLELLGLDTPCPTGVRDRSTVS